MNLGIYIMYFHVYVHAVQYIFYCTRLKVSAAAEHAAAVEDHRDTLEERE